MVGRSWCVMLAFAAAGCLTDPKPNGDDDDVVVIDAGVGSDAPAVVDAAPASDADPPLGCAGDAGTPFPPAATTAFRAPQVVRLNGDALDDLLLVDPLTARVYMILGRNCGFGTIADGQHLADDTVPYAATVAELGGSEGELDLIVLGAQSGTGHLLVYRGVGPLEFSSESFKNDVNTHAQSATFVPQASDLAFVITANFDDDARVDLVLGHEVGVYTAVMPADLESLTQPSFGAMPMTLLEVPTEYASTPGSWAGRPAPLVYRSIAHPPTDDLVISTDPYVFRHENDGATNFTRESTMSTGSNQHVTFYDIFAGDEVPEVFGVQSGSLSVTVYHPAGSAKSYRMVVGGGVGSLDDIAVANFDADPRPDMVFLDNHEGLSDSVLVLYRNAELMDSVDPMVVPASGPFVHNFTDGFHPSFVVAGNFTGDAEMELLAIDDEAGIRCLDLATGFNPCVDTE